MSTQQESKKRRTRFIIATIIAVVIVVVSAVVVYYSNMEHMRSMGTSSGSSTPSQTYNHGSKSNSTAIAM